MPKHYGKNSGSAKVKGPDILVHADSSAAKSVGEKSRGKGYKGPDIFKHPDSSAK